MLLKVGQINIQVMFHDKNIESWMYKDISNWAINMKMRTFTLHFYSKPQVAFKTEDGAAISDAMEAHARALIKAKKEKTAGYAGTPARHTRTSLLLLLLACLSSLRLSNMHARERALPLHRPATIRSDMRIVPAMLPQGITLF